MPNEGTMYERQFDITGHYPVHVPAHFGGRSSEAHGTTSALVWNTVGDIKPG